MKLSFKSKEQLAWYMLGTDAGRRFVEWFCRKHFRRLISMRVGSALVEWLRGDLLSDMREDGSTVRVVVETFPDGYCRVYASERVSVAFVDRLSVKSVEAEVLEEEIAMVNCPRWAQGFYLDGRRCFGTNFRKCSDVRSMAFWLSRKELSNAIGKPKRKQVKGD